MKARRIWGGAALLALVAGAAAQAQWSSGQGWGPGYGGGMGLGRTDGPVGVDVSQIDGGFTVAVTVSGCGGVRDYRSFGTDVSSGDGQERDLSAALGRMLGAAREACGFEPRLATRMAEGFESAFTPWLEEQQAFMAGMDMNMTDMNAAGECLDDCNMM